MLYNPKWSTTPSLDGFIAWLREQDPTTLYDWKSYDNCACAQYAKSLTSDYWSLVRNSMMVRANLFAAETPWTFGALLDRLVAYRAWL